MVGLFSGGVGAVRSVEHAPRAPARVIDDSSVTSSDSDSYNDDLFLRSAFVTHRRSRPMFGDDDDDDVREAEEEAADDLLYHVRAGAVRVNGERLDISSKEKALSTAQRAPEIDMVGQEGEDEAQDRDAEVSVARRVWRKRQPLSVFVPSQIRTHAFGASSALGYRRYFKRVSVGPISPWHDIPASTGKPASVSLFMVTEMPKASRERQHMAVGEKRNPLKFQTEGGEIRRNAQPSFWNSGFFPQTWMDPSYVEAEFGLPGSNGPVEVIEIGGTRHMPGEVVEVRVLGALPMSVEGVLRWRIVAVDVNDPAASELGPVRRGDAWNWALVETLGEWFSSAAADDGTILNLHPQEKALAVIESAHEGWSLLRGGEVVNAGVWTGADTHRHALRQQYLQHREERQRRQQRYLEEKYLEQPHAQQQQLQVADLKLQGMPTLQGAKQLDRPQPEHSRPHSSAGGWEVAGKATRRARASQRQQQQQ